MDSNLFEYLIIIFFIVSALQSLFGKKKKQREQERRRQTQQRDQSARTPQQAEKPAESAKDILEEMFGLKIPQEEEKQTKIPSDRKTEVLDPADMNETTWNPEEEYEDSIGVETIRYADKKEQKPSYQEEMAALERKAERARESLAKLPDEIHVEEVGIDELESKLLAAKIKKTIRDPESLREYILVSELLNKPKALRR